MRRLIHAGFRVAHYAAMSVGFAFWLAIAPFRVLG